MEGDSEQIYKVSRKTDWGSFFGFEDYLSYCNLDESGRRDYKKYLRDKLMKSIERKPEYYNKVLDIQLSFENDVDDSAFTRQDIYIDALNDSYILL